MKMFKVAQREFWRVLPLFLFFLICFTLINWIETYLLEQAGLRPYRFIEILVAAGLIAKIVIVVNHLNITHLFQYRPLIYGVVWKTVVYWTLLLIVRLCVHFAPFLFGGSWKISEDLQAFLQASNWQLFISIQVYYLMLLFIFVTFQELADKIGHKQIKKIFFG